MQQETNHQREEVTGFGSPVRVSIFRWSKGYPETWPHKLCVNHKVCVNHPSEAEWTSSHVCPCYHVIHTMDSVHPCQKTHVCTCGFLEGPKACTESSNMIIVGKKVFCIQEHGIQVGAPAPFHLLENKITKDGVISSRVTRG